MASVVERPRVILDTSVLISAYRHAVWTLAKLGIYEAYWSTFIVAELVRVRYRMTLRRAVRAGLSLNEVLKSPEYDERFDRLIHELSDVLGVVDYRSVLIGHVLSDAADEPVLATALAARAGYIVSLNTRDFPTNGRIMGVHYVTPPEFFDLLHGLYPEHRVLEHIVSAEERLP
jgi:predicted nucleic acid-binding protein